MNFATHEEALDAKRVDLLATGFAPEEAATLARSFADEHFPPPQSARRPSHAEVLRNQRSEEYDDQPALPTPTIALELMERDMPPISYLREPWISEGLTILAGRPKLGKTTLLRQKLAAVAGGDPLFGAGGAQRPTIFLCLEEGDRLARKKFEMAGFDDRALANIIMYFKWRRGNDGVLDLHRVLDQYPNVKYVGIDSLTRFRDVPDARIPAFRADYDAVSALHAIAKARPGLCIDLIHHTRKAKSDDPLDDISGTYGLTAACDSYWVMRYHEDGAVLHVGGRLWESDTSQFQLRRGKQVWELVGEFTGASTTQTETLDVLRGSKGMTPTEVATAFNIKKGSAFDRLGRLVAAGLAYSRDGRYYAK